METWTQVAGNAAFFLGPILIMLGVQAWQERQWLRKSQAEIRTRGRR